MRQFLFSAAALAFLALTACTPSPKQMKDAIEKDPSIVFQAIEKDPRGFFAAIERGQKAAQAQMEDDMWKNPLQPAIDESRTFEGNKTGTITIVEYADFLCGHCKNGHFTMKDVIKKYPQQVRILFKNKPILHPVSMLAAEHFVAISMNNPEAAVKFKDLAFTNQDQIKDAIKADAKGGDSQSFKKTEKLLQDFAKKAGADLGQLAKNLKDPKVMEQIQADSKESDKFEFSGTPGYIVNGVPVRGAAGIETFAGIIDRHLSAKN